MSDRQEAQAERTARLRDPIVEEPLSPGELEAAVQSEAEAEGAFDPGPTPAEAYFLGLDVVEEGIAVTILVPWPSVSFRAGGEDGSR